MMNWSWDKRWTCTRHTYTLTNTYSDSDVARVTTTTTSTQPHTQVPFAYYHKNQRLEMRRARTGKAQHIRESAYAIYAHLCERDNVLRGALVVRWLPVHYNLPRFIFAHTWALFFHTLFIFFLAFSGSLAREERAANAPRIWCTYAYIYNVNERNKKKITMNTQLLKFPRRKVIRRLYIYCI